MLRTAPLSLPLLLLVLAACDGGPKDSETGTLPDGARDADQDGYTADVDCDDTDPDVHPDASEACNDRDDDCDDAVDEEGDQPFYADSDGDGWGDPLAMVQACTAPSGYVDDDTDCNDTSAEAHPGATEVCDGLDNDCDGSVDEEGGTTWFRDADLDGYGDPAAPVTSCAHGADEAENDQDCDDTTAAANPAATEICDEIDNDCDGATDEDVMSTFYADRDGDGYGVLLSTTEACTAPTGYAPYPGDCDEGDDGVNPGATEVCDGLDNNCDDVVDGADASGATAWYADDDGDGYGDPADVIVQCDAPTGYVADGTDCDDASRRTHPGSPELCNSTDDDCDGTVDDTPMDGTLYYVDADGDGFGDAASALLACSTPTGYTTDDTDCDDGDATVSPATTTWESPGDGVDQNCDGHDGCADLNCDDLPDLLFPCAVSDTTGPHTPSRVYYHTGSGYTATEGLDLDSLGAVAALAEDLDGDGFVDVVLANNTSGTSYSVDSYVYWGSPSGHSTADRTDLPTVGAYDVTAGDLDVDGWPDLVFANFWNGTTRSTDSYIYWGSPTGFSRSDRTELPTVGALDAVIRDLDADGWPDLVFAQYNDDTSYDIDSTIYWGSAAGFSTTDRTDLPAHGPREAIVEDLDGDGRLDILLASYLSSTDGYDGESYIYWGTSAGYSTGDSTTLSDGGALGVGVYDLDADGWTDIVLGGYTDDGRTYDVPTRIWWGSPSGFSSADTSELASYGTWGVVADDLDGDGWGDVALACQFLYTYTTTSRVWWGASSGFSSTDVSDLSTYGPLRVMAADLNADGYKDLVYSNYYADGTYANDAYVYYGSATGYSVRTRDDLPVEGAWGVALVVPAD